MIDWYIEVSEYAPESYKSEKFLNKVVETVKIVMDHVCVKLNDIDYGINEDGRRILTIEDVNTALRNIVDDLPVMTPFVRDGVFSIRYNSRITILLVDSTKTIYRDMKLNKILNTNG